MSKAGRHRIFRASLLMVAGTVALLMAGVTTAQGAVPKVVPQARPASTISARLPAIGAPSKALCKQAHYKIGYDVWTSSQAFSDIVTNALMASAKSIGCVTMLKTIDNENGPVAVGNLKTLVEEGIQGFVDFQILAPFQPAMASELKTAKIPGVSIIGAPLPGWPGVGANNYTSAYDAGVYLATVAKKRFPGKAVYFLDAAETSGGVLIMSRYSGAAAGAKKVLPDVHIVRVVTDGTETTSYSNAVSALSTVPSGAVVITQGENDEVTGGMFKAIQSRGFADYLANSYGGDSYGFSQVCAQPVHYVGSWYLEPVAWGQDALTVIMDEINHVKTGSVGIVGEEVTHSTSLLHCK
jgi:ABC-type sugar transport system substrate-binding protein